jgi:hypothetical protein
MHTALVLRCVLCNRLAELPFWHRTVAGQTAAGEVFTVDVPLCLECAERTRPAGDQGEAFAAAGE